MASVVVAEQLTKYYGPRLAVERVSFEVREKEVFGLLGPNGSGKSTILRILTGYLQPSAGRATVAGWDSVEDSLAARSKIGYVPEDIPLYPGMRVREFLRFMAEVRRVEPSQLGSAVDQAVERLTLGAVRDVLIGRLSRGYRQRVAIAQALLGKPSVLILDEPTNGLDPRQIIEVRRLIHALALEIAVLVTSHILTEVERISHRVAILLDGRLRTVHTLRGDDAATPIRVRVRNGDAAAVSRAIGGLPNALLLPNPPGSPDHLVRGVDPARLVPALVQAGLEVEEVTPAVSGLEELFLQVTEGAQA